MPLPVTFATLTQGNQPASLLDQNFAALGALTFIPCTAVGQNTIVLTPTANTPAFSAYTSSAPIFTWIQAQTTTGAVTIAVSPLAAFAAYGSNGGSALGAGDLAAGNTYQCSYNPNLNSGAGGFVVDSFSAVTTTGTWVPVLAGDSVAGTPVYITQQGSYEQIGRQVTARFVIFASALTGIAGNVQIRGLPFTCNSTQVGGVSLSYFGGWTPGSTYSFLGGFVEASTTIIKLIDSGPGVSQRLSPVTDFGGTPAFNGFANYSV